MSVTQEGFTLHIPGKKEAYIPRYYSYATELHLTYTCLSVKRLQRENVALKYISVQDEHVLQEEKKMLTVFAVHTVLLSSIVT